MAVKDHVKKYVVDEESVREESLRDRIWHLPYEIILFIALAIFLARFFDQPPPPTDSGLGAPPQIELQQ